MGTELEVRLAALHQAAHDLKGNATAEETVKRAGVYLEFLQSCAPEYDIAHMVSRFLTWKLPDNFNPDGGISFERKGHSPLKYGPSGTNLFDTSQAKAMVRYMLAGRE